MSVLRVLRDVRRRVPGPRRRHLPVLVCAVAVGLVAAAPPALADTAWGGTGASYTGGVTCHLGDDTLVPMARWDVDGTSTYATADISRTDGDYGPAPTSGPSSPIQPGDAGLDAGDIAASAYLIAHHGNDSAATVAEVSADIATAAGGGSLQSSCLGRSGTRRARASALFTQAQRYAGPYKVQLSLPDHAQPGKPTTIAARVTSAAGHPVPGITVTLGASGGTENAATAHNGIASTTITTPTAPSTPIDATISEPVSLTYFDTDPGAVTVAAPTTFSDTATLAPVLHPTPHVSTQAPGLVLRNGTITPRATITGTSGYAGEGAISLLGPLHAGQGKSCSSLGSGDYGKAPTAWKGNFGFVGDGTQDAGKTPELAAGCYAVTASITTTNTSPPAAASSGYGTTIVVSKLVLSESTGTGVSPAGALTAVVTGTDAGKATVRTSITVHGPLTPASGSCTGDLDWAQAPIHSVSDAVTLTTGGAAAGNGSAPSAAASPTSPASATPTASVPPASAPPTSAPAASADDIGATITTPTVSKVGCYALSSRSIISQNGHTIVVQPSVGGAGSTTLVAAPTLTINDADYDGQVGKPMTGTISVVGSYRFAGTLSVGLASAPRTDVGCREATFPNAAGTTQTGAVVTSSTPGDGTMRFTTPPARKNQCYSVTAVLRLKVNPNVVATSPDASTSSVFLAGVVLRTQRISGLPGTDNDALVPTAIAIGATLLIIFGVAIAVIVRAFARRNLRTA